MNPPNPADAAERLKQICESEGVHLRELARDLNVPVSTLQHYWGESGYKGEKLPINKPHLRALRETLMVKLPARRAEIADLFPPETPDATGLLWQELHDIREQMSEMARLIKALIERSSSDK